MNERCGVVMRVLLMENVRHLGVMGEVVTVAPGYGRNYLIPQKKACLATKSVLKDFQNRKEALEKSHHDAWQQAVREAEKLDNTVILFLRKASESKGLYGSVTKREISEKLQEVSGVHTTPSQIVLPHPIRSLGVFEVEVRFFSDVVKHIRVNVAQTDAEAAMQMAEPQSEGEQKEENTEITA